MRTRITDEDQLKMLRDRQDEYDFDAECEEVARKRGLIVVMPEPNELQIDLDSEESRTEFYERLSNFNFGYSKIEDALDLEWFNLCEWFVSRSHTAGHFHAYLRTEHKFTDLERIAWQAALGDDPVRFKLNMMRLRYGIKNPSRLFERPDFKRKYAK